ncbi:DUF1616 domain-containing protein [Chloroflexota bacterium]
MDWLSPIREFFGFTFFFPEGLSIIRAIFGSTLVFFLPGFAWTIVFFKRINVIERVLLSFALSMVVVTLSILFINRLLGFKITGTSSALIIIIVTVLPIIAYYFNKLIRRRRGNVK